MYIVIFTVVISYSTVYMNGEVHVMFVIFSSYSHLANILNMCIYEVMSVGC
jgi:hypothetical protein